MKALTTSFSVAQARRCQGLPGGMQSASGMRLPLAAGVAVAPHAGLALLLRLPGRFTSWVLPPCGPSWGFA